MYGVASYGQLPYSDIPATGSGNTLTVPLGVLTVTGLAPTFIQSHSLVVPLGILTLTGLAPSFGAVTVKYVSLAYAIGDLSRLGITGLSLGVGGVSYEEDV